MHWQTTRFRIDLGVPRVMGIVNVTPDSFAESDPADESGKAIERCERLVCEGAHLLDIGGESSRPGAARVPEEVERARVLPVIAAALGLGVPVSVDTRTPAVMQAALDLGADIVNDIQALRAEGALDAIARHPTCGVCLMHMKGEPGSMQRQPTYGDVVADVAAFLRERCAVVQARGVAAERIVLDPGIGFGKTPAHNLELLRRQRELLALGRPLLVGWSRKSTLGVLSGRAVHERLVASVAAALAAVAQGARIVRVHDVAATVEALAVWQAAGLGVDNPPASGTS